MNASMLLKLAVPVLVVFAMLGCESTGTKGEAGEGAAVVEGGQPTGGATAQGVGRPGQFTSEELDNPSSPLAKRVIYFDFDSSIVSEADYDTVAAHGLYLADHASAALTVEGHTDERGSREYNLALGERRAQAVRQILMLQGARDSQVQTVSYGEERPVALGHDESAWRLNRRAELVYRSK
jgi:peptidoglycan-associated lipoprotein